MSPKAGSYSYRVANAALGKSRELDKGDKISINDDARLVRIGVQIQHIIQRLRLTSKKIAQQMEERHDVQVHDGQGKHEAGRLRVIVSE